jgi:hypothetical protein
MPSAFTSTALNLLQMASGQVHCTCDSNFTVFASYLSTCTVGTALSQVWACITSRIIRDALYEVTHSTTQDQGHAHAIIMLRDLYDNLKNHYNNGEQDNTITVTYDSRFRLSVHQNGGRYTKDRRSRQFKKFKKHIGRYTQKTRRH